MTREHDVRIRVAPELDYAAVRQTVCAPADADRALHELGDALSRASEAVHAAERADAPAEIPELMVSWEAP